VTGLEVRCARATEERSASDSAGGGTVDVVPIDVVMVPAPEPEEPGEAHEAKQTLVEAVVVVRVGRRVAGVLRRSPRRGTGAREADEEERAEQ
jgi:hypothetical protein